ncbi:MAG: PRC-barrel domain-containing protein [Candidatus Saccharibacteria bacterium]
MQVLQSEFSGKPIMGVHTGEQLCVVTGFVVHPGNLKIILFIANAPLQKQPYYLLPNSIRFADSKRLIIDSAQSLSEFDELVRYQHDILHNFNPIKKKVITQSGKKLGTVVDFSFDNQHNFIQKLYVRASFFKRFLQAQFIIDRNSVIETTPNSIIVKDTVDELPATIKSPLPNKPPAKGLARSIKKSPN